MKAVLGSCDKINEIPKNPCEIHSGSTNGNLIPQVSPAVPDIKTISVTYSACDVTSTISICDCQQKPAPVTVLGYCGCGCGPANYAAYADKQKECNCKCQKQPTCGCCKPKCCKPKCCNSCVKSASNCYKRPERACKFGII